MIHSNIVNQKDLREVQLETLKVISDALVNSYGPMGSNTEMVHFIGNGESEKDRLITTESTKDGHKILKNIHFSNILEESIRENINSVTANTVRGVGDGTTTAVVLSEIIFRRLQEIKDMTPYDIIRNFKTAVQAISDKIVSNKKEFTPEVAYEIAYTSTNGNTEIAEDLMSIYKKYGKDVFIDVKISNDEYTKIKEYDGMTLEEGYMDSMYVNRTNSICSISNPKIYAFEDPVDTPEMMKLFESMVRNAIFAYTREGQQAGAEPVPTVILAPKISRDMTASMKSISDFMLSFKGDDVVNRPELLVVSNLMNSDLYYDITRMCGCIAIKKYLDPKVQEEDIKKGIAPTPENIENFAGSAQLVESDAFKTKVVNPKNMIDENGDKTQEYRDLLAGLEAVLKKAQNSGEGMNVTGNLKRRIKSLKANMIEYMVGGISIVDRDSTRDLVEDAVLNCRSASSHGVGSGANFEGYRAVLEICKNDNENPMYNIILDAYEEIITKLYSTMLEDPSEILKGMIEHGCAYNLRTNESDNKVLCSIETDKVILDGIARIVTIMFTTNQFLCPTPGYNNYTLAQ